LGHHHEDMFQQFQEGLKDCLSQMTAYKIEMENLRRNAHEEGNGKQHPSSEKTTFPLSYGDHGGKAPPGGPKGGNGNKSGHGSKSSGQGKSGGQGDWRDRGPCYKCGDVGHWIKNCPLNKKGGQDQLAGQSHEGASSQHQQTSTGTQYEPQLQLIGQPMKKMTYLNIHWRGKQYNGLLDTGCEVSVEGKRLLPSGIELSPPTNDLYAANRTKIPTIGRTSISFSVYGKEYTADLAVTNTVDELILGIDWLMAKAAQWDFEHGRIFLGGKWITLQQSVTAD